MSRVLVLARELPYPPNAGDRIVTYGFLSALARRGHDVHLLAYAREDEADDVTALREVCTSVERVAPPEPPLSMPTPLVKAARYALGRSHVMEMFDSPAFREAARQRVRDVAPAVVLAQHPYIGRVFLDDGVAQAVKNTGARQVTNAHVVEYAAHERHREYADDLMTRGELALEVPRLREAELAVYEQSDRTLVLGEEDRRELADRVPGPVQRQRVALDVDDYDPASHDETVPNRLLFFGSYDWFPNEDAALYLGERILPILREQRPAVEVLLAGRGVTPAVRALDEKPNARVLGEVDDLASLVRTAAAVVAPLRIGGGVRIKVLESMAWGVPVVTTGQGFEGVEATPGDDLLVVDDPEAFATETAALLGDPERRRLLARNGRETIKERYDIRTVSPQLEANLGLQQQTSLRR